jgi:hypothetical protein
MVKLRTKSLTIKFTPEEWEIIARVAGREPIATWARDLLLALAPAPTPFEVVTAEILALRTLVLHVQLAPFGGEPVTAESLRRLMASVLRLLVAVPRDLTRARERRLGRRLKGPER